ncbi:AAA family ATPase [Cardinium endosymbiont of Culicoides punctatus]|uniref:AAA family ATPase n=1 Tax=Cardinium endosymbiont of Culicoides punctatus TaxID=2304601 RepID=UPI001058E19B|nr:AAA family ATPase [Cardinium endosymbiont of Culicoides punctatus]TDG95008.1 hypothetical protein CCPUN_06650 [Cardinium endosymbiont of Culicoides punctatus]
MRYYCVLILSLFSCKADKYNMDGDKLEEIGHNNKRQKLAYTGIIPISKSDIEEVIQSGFYADKTAHVWRLIKKGGPCFLVRPRRFGKSLLIDTIAKIAEGERYRHLFTDCCIGKDTMKINPHNPKEEQKKYDWKKYPVIRLDFSKLENESAEILKMDLQRLLYNTAKKYSVESKLHNPIGHNSFQSYYENLIDSLKKLKDKDNSYKSKIVLLIDEYDAPVINLDWDSQNYKDCMKVLSDFFTVIKSCANDCQLLFVTGVYKFVLSGLGSGANIFYGHDLSIYYEDFSDVVGYKEEHINSLFTDKLSYVKEQLHKKTGKMHTNEEVLQVVRQYYNGYKFYPFGPSVYNPTSVLSFFETGKLVGYWKDTADTRVLIKQMQDHIQRFSLDKISGNFLQKEDDLLETTALKELDIIPLMYQTGYITIKDYDVDEGKCVLDFPNTEVKEALHAHFGKYLANKAQENGIKKNLNVQEAFKQEDWQKLFYIFRSDCYAKASYELTEKSEKYFHALLFSFLNGVFLGNENVEISAETISNIGQADIVIKDTSNNTIYILELKLNKDSYTGLKQIISRDYYGQYVSEYDKIVCMGLNIIFNDDNKNNPDPSHRNMDECTILVSRLDDNHNWSDDPIKKFSYSPRNKSFLDSVLSNNEINEIYKAINKKNTRDSRKG